MPNCTVETMTLGKVGRRTIEASFDGGDISSDAGVLLLRQADERIGLTRAVARVFADAAPRRQRQT
jgi:RimJ/RimL family protein N-acetyltransferase